MKKNILFALAILAVAGALALALYTGRAQGGEALVSIADAGTHTISLAKDGVYTFGEADGAKLTVTLRVQDGRIRFENSQCPDHICEGFGWLSNEGDEAICLPAGVVVSVERAQNPRSASAVPASSSAGAQSASAAPGAGADSAEPAAHSMSSAAAGTSADSAATAG